MKRRIIDILLVTIGSFISAVGYNSLLVKNNIASGGVGGLAISLNALFGQNNANFVLATTIPLLILCWCFLGREVLLKTLYGSLVFPTFIKLTEGLPTLTKQPLLASIFGGIILGLGLGIVFYGNSSTGGEQGLPHKFLINTHLYLQEWSYSQLMESLSPLVPQPFLLILLYTPFYLFMSYPLQLTK